MSANRRRRLEELFQAALARSPAARGEFLRTECGDDRDLLEEIEGLLERSDASPAWPAAGPHARALELGSRVGGYQIISLLGVGGMGEVYRARDVRLGREVAFKVLPAELAADPERLDRFEREARVLASLSHPNIATIYGVEDVADGEQSRIRAIVLELVEGDTLADLIARGRPDLDDALRIAAQIISALAAAHEQGIVHRDLKPANIKITRASIVKVLDFGLAKLKPRPDFAGAASPSGAPTTTAGATAVGVLAGTPAYMSPEQARGQAVDHRADIWAFGCVLYEMVTGRRAFAGSDMLETLARVVDSQPDLRALPSQVPGRVRGVLARCLEKDPRRRFQHIGDVQLALDGAFDVPAPAPEPRSSAGRRVQLGLAIAVVAAALGATAALAWTTARRSPTAPPRFISFGEELRAGLEWPQLPQVIAVAPDGGRIFYVGQAVGTINRRIFVRSMDRMDTTVLANDAGNIVLSPDGEWVAYTSPAGAFLKQAVNGGEKGTISGPGSVSGFASGHWGPGGSIAISTVLFNGLIEIPAAGGEPVQITHPPAAERHTTPRYLPDGRSMLFTIQGPSQPDRVAVLLPDRTIRVLFDGSHPRFVESGHVLFMRGRSIWAVPFDLGRLAVVGDPQTVLNRVALGPVGRAPWFDVANDGTLVYVPDATTTAQREVVAVGRDGREQPVGLPPGPYVRVKLSPDGSKIAVDADDDEQDIWIWDGQRLARFTSGSAGDGYALWTPDGKDLVFASDRDGPGNLYRQAADLTGSVVRLTTAATLQLPTAFSPDGRLLYAEVAAGGIQDIKLLALSDPARSETLIASPSFDRNGSISSDGRWIAYDTAESGRPEVVVRPFPNVRDGRWQVSTTGGTRPVWRRDGRELLYLDLEGRLMSVAVTPGTPFTHGAPARILNGPYYVPVNGSYDVSLDGQSFLMIKTLPGDLSERPRLHVVLNWLETLKQRAPSRS